MSAKYDEGYLSLGKQSIRIYYRSWCPARKKAALICFHTAYGNSSDFAAFAGELVRHGYEVIAVDLPGYGFSKPIEVAPEHGLRLRVAIFDQVARSFEGVAGLLCASGSAIPGFVYLNGFSRDARVSGLKVIFSEPAFSFDRATRDFVQKMSRFHLGRYDSLDAAITRWESCFEKRMRFPDENAKREFVRGKVLPNGNKLVSKIHPSQLDRLLKTGDFDLLQGDCRQLANPCLTLWGEHGGSPKHESKLATIFPVYRSVVIADAVHPLSLTCEDEIAHIVDFLEE